MEAAGRPTVVIATEAFSALARQVARNQGLEGARIVCVAHPIGGIDDAALRGRADSATDAVLALLTRG